MRKISACLMMLGFGAAASAQDCANYLFMSNNTQVQMTIYDQKGKEGGKQTWTIENVKKNSNGYESNVTSVMANEKGKELGKANGVYKCINGMLQADVRMSMPQQQMQAYKEGKAKVETAYLEYPNKLTEGQSLKEVEFEMQMEMSNGLPADITFKQSNRKVDKKESITTPAGSWNAFVISYDGYFQAKIAGIGVPFNFKGKEWFAPGVGIIKTESYNKSGKLIGSTLITSIKKK